MKKSVFQALFLGIMLTGCAEKKPEIIKEEPVADPTVFYLIRHAEKDRSNPDNKDPELKQEGHERAVYWEHVFKEVPLSAVYSTNYKRTLQTALPTARSKNLEVILYDPDTTNLKHWAENLAGKHILVVGHSNTTPALTNQLVGEGSYKDIDDSNNGNLYIVQYGKAVSSSVLSLEPTHSPDRQ